MKSSAAPSLPSPPPYAARHTIVNVGTTKLASPPADPLEGSRTLSSLNIVFSPPPSLGRGTAASSGSKRVPSPLSPTYSLQSHFDKQSKGTTVGPPLTRSSSGHHEVLQIYRSGPEKTSIQNPIQPKVPTSTDLNAGLCAECDSRITNWASACQALGCIYHNDCFVCCCCRRTLRDKIFYKDHDKIYCEDDYLYCGFQRTAEKCEACGHIISQTILQTLGKSYHPGCFRCCICTKCLDQVPFTVDENGQVYCVPDYHLVHAPICAACAQPILPAEGSDDVLRVLAQDKEFHVECYRCEDCKIQLGNDSDNCWYPLVETLEGSGPTVITRTHLLCLQCHLSRIGASPAAGQRFEVRRNSNGSLSSDQGLGSGSGSLSYLSSGSRVYSPTPTSLGIASIGKPSTLGPSRPDSLRPWQQHVQPTTTSNRRPGAGTGSNYSSSHFNY
uniref:LIM domain-containing protein ajuba n=1 Tax=Schistocephalus solidus TaxID=70667 RepID=A0A0X3NW29_SCHSO